MNKNSYIILMFKLRKNILAEVKTVCQPPLFNEKETLWVISQIKLFVP